MKKNFLQIKENISVNHITNVQCDCADIYLLNSKKNNQEISLNQRNFSVAVYLAMKKLVLFKETFF